MMTHHHLQIIAFNADDNFLSYKGGVFSCDIATTYGGVNHAMLLVRDNNGAKCMAAPHVHRLDGDHHLGMNSGACGL